MERTVVRQLDTTAMIVGSSGPNGDRVTMALEQAKIRVLRLGSAAVACERVASAMPQVVVLVSPIGPAERDELVDRATAVGASVVEVAPTLEGEAFEELITEVITTAIQRKLLRDECEPSTRGASEPPADVDAGWD